MTILGFLDFLNFSFVDMIDILIVAALMYLLYTWIKGSSAMNIFFAIIIILLVRVLALALNMKLVSALMGALLDVGAIALIVIFQPEIRRFLNKIGSSAGKGMLARKYLMKILGMKDSTMEARNIREIAEACKEMSEQKTGALIVLRHHDRLEDILSTGDEIDSLIKSRLIQNIFFKNSPLHDGAMIIDRDRIVAARCTLPITEREDIPAKYGMRHKAAVGISEKSDADVIVVSEQTGAISFVRDGAITPVKGFNKLEYLLGKAEEEKSSEAA